MLSTQGQCQGCPLGVRMNWNFHGTIPGPSSFISTGIHSLGRPSVAMHKHPKTRVQLERLLLSDCHQWVLFTCQIVTLSLCCVASPNIGTSQAGQGCWDCSMKISVHFIHGYPMNKPNFSSVWRGPLSRWPFEHSSTQRAALTLTLCTQHCARVWHLHVPHQNSTLTHFSTA